MRREEGIVVLNLVGPDYVLERLRSRLIAGFFSKRFHHASVATVLTNLDTNYTRETVTRCSRSSSGQSSPIKTYRKLIWSDPNWNKLATASP